MAGRVQVALVVLLVLLLLALVYCGTRGHPLAWARHALLHAGRERFGGNESITVSWAPPANYPAPGRLTYNWALCIASGYPGSLPPPQQACQSPLPANPAQWGGYSGSTTAGQNATSITLNSLNCGNCDYGDVLSFAVQAYDPLTHAASTWAVTQITLTPTTQGKATLLDPSGNALAAGSTAYSYSLVLDQSVLGPGVVSLVSGTVIRGASVFTFPFVAATSAAGATITYQGTFTAAGPTSPWSNGALPGPLQVGDVVYVDALVYKIGLGGPVYYYQTVQTTAQIDTPAAPTQIAWQLN